MNFAFPNFTPALPEIWVLCMTCVILLSDLFLSHRIQAKFPQFSLTYFLTQFTLIVAFGLSIALFPSDKLVTFSGAFILDKIAAILKLFIYITSFFAFIYSRLYVSEREMPVGEYFVLGLFSILGMMVLVSSHNFLSLFLGIELLSLPLYAMVAVRRDASLGAEAAMKYFVTGALATGMLLYGISMIYGATYSIDFSFVDRVVNSTPISQSLILIFGLVFLVAGLVFKVGAAPFHMWVPDVYQGAPTSVTLFIGSAPKIAALGMAIRLLVDATPSLYVQWQQLFILVAIFSMGLGNLVAIVQTNIKRLLAYSAIAHMGYMSLGLLAATPSGYAAAVFYMFAYALMTLGAFGIIILLSRAGIEAETIEDFKGLSQRHPWLAFMMLLVMFSMAGVPPFIGFFAKLGVLEALINVNLVWLAALALLFAIIGAYYYIAIVKVMYFEDATDGAPIIETSMNLQIAITLNGMAVLLLGIFPSQLINLCRMAF